MRVSHSELTTYLTCPRKHHHAYRDRQVPRVKSDALTTGSRVDKALKYEPRTDVHRRGNFVPSVLSVNAIEYAYTIVRKMFEQAIKNDKIADERRAEKHVDAPTGRVTFRGKVVSRKLHENAYGETWKMTVKVETTNGSWLAWGTIPSELLGNIDDQVRVGDEVELTGTLSQGNEKHFAFFKRPSKASVIKKTDAAA